MRLILILTGKVSGCQKRYTDPSSLRKHVKTFNHESIMQSQMSAEKSDETMDCEVKVDATASAHSPQSVYYGFNEQSGSNEPICWMAKHIEITDKMETIRLEPLDLRVHHNR